MTDTPRKSLREYLDLQYPMQVIAAPEGGYVIVFPDLPGCMTQVETADEIGPMAEDARRGWMESVYEIGPEIPLPSYPEEYSGKFNLRIPRSLHRELSESADREGVSLNQYVTQLLSGREALRRVERRFTQFEARFDNRRGNGGYSLAGSPLPSRNRQPLASPFAASPDQQEAARQSLQINEGRAEYDDRPAAPPAGRVRRGRAKRSVSDVGTT